MKKKIVISIIAVVAVVGGIIGFNYMGEKDLMNERGHGINKVVASGYREGILISPTSMDGTGINVDSDFLITFEEGHTMSIDEVKQGLKIEPLGEVSIQAEADGYLIAPKGSFEKNSLVKITLDQVTWMFQCETDFGLIGSLPRHEGTNVPMNSGIELYFSHEGAEVEDYFTIEPFVKGDFKVYGSTVVFVPELLAAKTVYTITLKEGLSLKTSDKVLAESYSFSFETGMNEEEVSTYPKGYFNYYSSLNDFALSQPIYIPMNFSVNEPSNEGLTITTKVYVYKEVESMTSDLADYLDLPTWRNYYEGGQLTSTESLDLLIEFDQSIEDLHMYETTIDVPVALDEGVYLVQSTWEDLSFQTFVQVTDLSYLYFEDEENNYYWVNDLATDQPAVGAFANGNVTNVADENGFLRVVKEDESTIVTSILSYKEKEVVQYNFNNQNAYNAYNHYWKYIQTDRNLYKPTDEVKLFGFVQNRDSGEYPEVVTVSIDEQRWYYGWFWPSVEQEVPLVSEVISVEKGFFEGAFTLPNLEEGGYQVEVKSGVEVIGTHYIQVENYVKPDYKIAVTSDKKAVFLNENVRFTTKTSFYEGTPVADLVVNYDLYGMNFESGTGETNNDGEFNVDYSPSYSDGYQDEVYAGYSTYASLPESGELFGQLNVRVFVNDLHVDVETTVDEGIGTIDASVHNIVLDRLNDGTALDAQDYLGQPVQGQVLYGAIYRNEWVKEISGEYYDFINKVTRKRYHYRMDTTLLKNIDLTTDKEGKVIVKINLPKVEDVYYTLELSTKDGHNHPMKFERYFGKTYEDYYRDDTHLYMTSNEETYHVGDEMKVEMFRGKVPAVGLKYLTILGASGLKELVWSDEPSIELPYTDDYLPEVEVIGVLFNGEGYEIAQSIIPGVVQEDYAIDLELATDKTSYQPGDEVTVSVVARTKDGLAVTDGRVNISIVDEALFALSDQVIDPLGYLYGWVGSGLSQMTTSHNNLDQGGNYPMVRGYGMEETAKADFAGDQVMSESMTANVSDVFESPASIEVRTDFKDTAIFKTLKLDGQGRGVIQFTLPDNVTSWRLTAAAISESLNAGSEIEALNVSLPFFINTTMNQTYLVGDYPQISVTGYGNDLLANEKILYTVICKEVGYSVSAESSAFERVRIPLFELDEGTYKIQVIAQSASGMSDGYEEVITVLPTYQEKRVSETYVAEEGLTIDSSDFGMTSLTFVDRSRGMYISNLYQLTYSGGKRVDQLYLSYLAANELSQSFGIETGTAEVSLADYMTNEGGIALLPYSDADLETSVKFAGIIEEGNSKNRLKGYLYNAYYHTSSSNKTMALYGLISMGEPLLNELNQQVMVENLTIEDNMWLAMGYAAIGDTYKANLIYKEVLVDYMETFEGSARFVLSKDLEEQYRLTSRILPLLADVDIDLGRDAYAYVNSHTSETYLANLDHYLYVLSMMAHATDDQGFVTYTFDGHEVTVDLTGFFGHTIKVPSVKISTFSVVEVTSDVLVVAEYNAIGNREGVIDDNIELQRHYEDYLTGEVKNSFKEGDIVKVVLDWRIDEQAIDYGYRITDYVPSGLVPIKNYWQFGLSDGHYWYRDIVGQKVSFGVYKGTLDVEPMVYYARVISPGSFKSDRAMIQGFNVLDSYNVTQSNQMIIEP